MPLRIITDPAADQDIEDQFDYLATRNLDAAIRYFDATEAAFIRLAEMHRESLRH